MTKHPWCSLVAPAHFPVSNSCPPALGGLSPPRPALPLWPLPLATHGMGGRCPALIGAGSGWGSGSGGSTCRRPQCQSQQLEPCWVRGACHPQGSLCLAVGSQSRDRWHKSCRVFIFPRLLPRTISRSPGLDRLWSEQRENCRAHQGSKGPACPTSGKDARYISAPACVASAQITSSCMIVVSP